MVVIFKESNTIDILSIDLIYAFDNIPMIQAHHSACSKQVFVSWFSVILELKFGAFRAFAS